MQSVNTRDKIWATFSTEPFPKTQPPGSLHLEFKRCGKPNCRCNDGQLHGPYVYRRWREGGRQRRQHIQISKLATWLIALEEARAEHVTMAEIKRDLRDAH